MGIQKASQLSTAIRDRSHISISQEGGGFQMLTIAYGGSGEEVEALLTLKQKARTKSPCKVHCAAHQDEIILAQFEIRVG